MTHVTNSDTAELTHLEEVIQRGLDSFLEVGNALALIRDKKLYKANYPTWGDYLRNRWGLNSAQRAQQLIDASTVADSLGDGHGLNESQLRLLKGVDDTARNLVIQVAVDASKQASTPLTGATIKRTIEALQEFQATGALRIGDEQVTALELLTGHVSDEIKEARQRHKQRLQEDKPPVVKGEVVVMGGHTIELPNGVYQIGGGASSKAGGKYCTVTLPDGVYQVIIYRKS